MYCKHCGHEVNDNAIICPNCGIATDKYMAVAKPEPSSKKVNGFAIAGMICAIAGIIGGNYILCLPSIVGLILSIVGMVKVKEYGSGFGYAIAGIIVGAIGLFIWVIVWVYLSILWYSLLFVWW